MSPSDVATEEATAVGEARRLVRLAWPVCVGYLGMMGMGAVDLLMVGHLGGDALAALALGTGYSFAMLVPVMGVASGATPLLARAYGAGDPRAAGRWLVRAVLLTALMAIPAMILHFVAAPTLALAGQPAELLPLASTYVAVVAVGIPAFVGFEVLRQFLQASGRMAPGAWAIVVGNLANGAANGVLIYGLLGFPALGALGSALATTLCRVAMLVALVALGWPALREAGPRLHDALDLGALGRLARVALPAGAQLAIEVWSFTATLLLMGWIGKVAVAAHVVALNLASISFMLPLGLSQAAATRVGNLVGAERSWRRTGWVATGMGAGLMVGSALGFTLAPGVFASAYTSDPAVVAVAVTLLPIAGAFQLFDGTQVVAIGVLRGLGDTAVPAVLTGFTWWVAALPLALLLAFPLGLGSTGVWLGLTCGLGLAAVVLVMRVAWLGRVRVGA